MGKFQVIAGSGHCGTKWLSKVLDLQTDMRWYHHLRFTTTGIPWQIADLRPPDDPVFYRYWRWLGGDLEHNNIGDSNSWPPHMLAQVHKHRHIDKVIYLTRNGIQQLYSLMTESPVLKQDPLPVAATEKLLCLYAIMPNKPKREYGDWNRFDKLCLMIAANKFMPDYLRGQGMIVKEYNLDELVNDPELVKELAPDLSMKTIREVQKVDINRKVKGNREPMSIWADWSKSQRQAFTEIAT